MEGETVWFIPAFPFLPDTSYLLAVELPPVGAGDDHRSISTIDRPPPAGPARTDVVAIYPTCAELPVNQLRLYIAFSNPMSEGGAARALAVRRVDDAERLPGVFASMEPELWDPERRRLTVLLDPGRIKRGLVPHSEAGYPLQAGVAIVVEVAPTLRDGGGRPLRRGATRQYQVGPPLRTRVDPSRWWYRVPPAGSLDALVVGFDRPLDHALLQHCLQVVAIDGVAAPGAAEVGPQERSWSFSPSSPWKPGRYGLTIDTRLEDLAGNSVARVFDRDLTRPEDAPRRARQVTIHFECTEHGAR